MSVYGADDELVCKPNCLGCSDTTCFRGLTYGDLDRGVFCAPTPAAETEE